MLPAELSKSNAPGAAFQCHKLFHPRLRKYPGVARRNQGSGAVSEASYPGGWWCPNRLSVSGMAIPPAFSVTFWPLPL